MIKSESRHGFKTLKREKMVGWYDPPQLLRTGLEVVVSTLFARHSDSRRLDALVGSGAVLNFDTEGMLNSEGDFWFDYVADCGDGWDSTYGVAYALSQPLLRVDAQNMHRGRLLVLGGDLVYPTPNKDNYDARLIGPYQLAAQFYDDEPAEVLAIPGNHDWYDSLVAFRRLFFIDGALGFGHVSQTRSYCAARLPKNWWLFAVDLQLDHDLDQAQYTFFADVCEKKLSSLDRVLLCVAEPIWLSKPEQIDTVQFRAATLISKLREQLGHRLILSIAGDLHHYRRHSDDNGHHLITCGTGGAFLHPTHELKSETIGGDFKLRASFPTKRKSFWLTFMNLGFVTRNPKFGIVTAISYLVAAWQNGIYVGERFSSFQLLEIGRLGLEQWQMALVTGLHSALLSPIGLALYAIIFWGFVFFADRSSTLFRVIGGTVHALTHVGAGFLIYWFAAYVAISIYNLPPKSIPQYLVTGVIIFSLSWIIGSVILGTYLLISLNLFKKHSNEAFSSLRIKDWKGFLRGRIRSDGDLELTFIGLQKVPRSWVTGVTARGKPVLVPKDPRNFKPTIEDRVEIPAGRSTIRI